MDSNLHVHLLVYHVFEELHSETNPCLIHTVGTKISSFARELLDVHKSSRPSMYAHDQSRVGVTKSTGILHDLVYHYGSASLTRHGINTWA
jgi:hypothetical protein